MSNITNDTIREALNNPDFSFIESFADAGDSSKVTRELTALVFKHRKKREQLTHKERQQVQLENRLKKLQREAYVKHSNAQNERSKAILVEIDTEEEAFKVKVVEQQIVELKRDLSGIKLEIDTFKAISYNLRTEMGSF